MTDYIIYRKGSNAANQPCEFGWVPVYSCEAISRTVAVEIATWAGVTCYSNQRMEARPASRCSKTDLNNAFEATNQVEAEAAMADAEVDYWETQNA